MTMDRASTEHNRSGQIGQPAACMMDSKVVLSAGCATAIMACAHPQQKAVWPASAPRRVFPWSALQVHPQKAS